MRTAHKRWGAAGAALVLVCVGVTILVRSRTGPHRFEHETTEQVANRWRGFPAGTPDMAAEPSRGPDAGPATPEQTWFAPRMSPAELEAAMDAWREAIRERDADKVLTLDRAFTLLPGRYGPALEKLAVDDPDERVRAFSARVLGKAKNVALADLFRRFLMDPSAFVRQNGAWALGELVGRPGGLEAAEPALGELRNLAGSDPSGEVRAAATQTLRKLQ